MLKLQYDCGRSWPTQQMMLPPPPLPRTKQPDQKLGKNLMTNVRRLDFSHLENIQVWHLTMGVGVLHFDTLGIFKFKFAFHFKVLF